MSKLSVRLLACLLCLGLWSLVSSAQDAPRRVTVDEVNAIAEGLYCPVCENIPLDDCGTETCIQWKDEIALMLSEGMNAQQIVDNFVGRYGQKVVGVPQDPTLRGVSLYGALALVLAIIIGGGMTLWRWSQRGTVRPSLPLRPDASAPLPSAQAQDYLARLERDL